MHTFKVVGGMNCPFCVQAKDTLLDHNYQYTWIDINEKPEERQKLKDMGFKTIPQIWYGDQHIGGFTELVSFLGDLNAVKEGQLEKNNIEQYKD